MVGAAARNAVARLCGRRQSAVVSRYAKPYRASWASVIPFIARNHDGMSDTWRARARLFLSGFELEATPLICAIASIQGVRMGGGFCVIAVMPKDQFGWD